MKRQNDILSIAHRSLDTAITRIESFVDGDYENNPEMMLSVMDELMRLKRASKNIEDYRNKPVDKHLPSVILYTNDTELLY